MLKSGSSVEKEEAQYRKLLRDYAAISSRRPGAVEATAIRHQAPGYRDILAYQATGNSYTYEELKALIQDTNLGSNVVKSFSKLGALGRVVLLQNIFEDDIEIGEAFLSLAVERISKEKTRPYRRMLVQAKILRGQFLQAQELLEALPDLDVGAHKHLHTDVINPFINPAAQNTESWLEGFNIPFRKFNLHPIGLTDEQITPFDRLTSYLPQAGERTVQTDKKVSVIFTSYRPKRDEIFAAVRSVLAQTWTNLEIIVVNDSSGPEYDPVFDDVASLDARIQVVSTPRNSGTYAARNLGFGLARGDYLTGHDDDDWSHPQRIEIQVAFLETNPRAAGCRVHSIACDENLVMTRLGKSTPQGSNASSLMLPKEIWDEAGGFLPVRKAADTEIFHRVERLTQRTVHDIRVPLTVIRKASGSLSDAEFSAGWSHPARRAFKSAYQYWHENASDLELTLETQESLELDIPLRFQIDSNDRALHFDVIFAGDWHPYGGPQRSMMEEIKALISADKRVGIMHLEPARFMSTQERGLNPQIVELINSGQVTNVFYDDVASTDLLFLRYPPIMQFPPADRSNVKARRVIVVANQAPEELDGSDIRYVPSMVHENTVAAFSGAVTWAPQSDMVRERLINRLDRSVIEDFNIPGILNIDEWFADRQRFRSALPVVGRHSRDDSTKWPESTDDLKAAYPLDGTFDVRILGGARTALQVLKRTTIPGGWTVYNKDQLSPQRFLRTLDFYVFFQHSDAVEAFGRSILEAIASGLVVILPYKFRPVFGESALYSTPARAGEVVRQYFEDRKKYDAQVERAQNYISSYFSHSSYLAHVNTLLRDINEEAY